MLAATVHYFIRKVSSSWKTDLEAVVPDTMLRT